MKYLVWLPIGVAIGAFLAWNAYVGRQCGGPLAGLGVNLTQAVVLGVAVILAFVAVLVAVLRRTRAVPVSLLLLAAGLFGGWWIGLELARPNDPCPREPPETTREASATLRVELGAPYSTTLTGGGDCYVSLTTGRAEGAIQGSAASAAGLEITFWGLPVVDPTGRPFDAFDVDLYDGERGWGYRPTNWEQVHVDSHGPLEGSTRLVALPLLEDTRPTGSPVADSISGEISWQCDVVLP